MGIKNLNKLLKKKATSGITKTSLKDLNKTYIAIDISIFLYKYSTVKTCSLLEHLLFQLNHLLSFGITPLYLFDGKPSEHKNELIQQRRANFKNKKKEIDELEEQIKLMSLEENVEKVAELEQQKKKKEKTFTKINYNDVNEFKKVLELCGIFYYKCPGETDEYIREFFRQGIIEYAITEDLDFLTHGCPKVIYDYNYKNDDVVIYNLNDILEELKINQDQFIDMSIMMGCDYMESMKGIGPITGYNLITKHLNIETVIEKTKYKFNDNNYQCVRDIFNGNDIEEISFTKHTTQINYKQYQMNVNEINSMVSNKLIQNKLSNNLLVKKKNKTKNIMTFLKNKK